MVERVCDDDDVLSVDAVLENWRQGDCAVGGDLWFIHRFAPGRPLTPASAVVAAREIDLVESRVEGFVVVSQTCDVVRASAKRPYVEVVPLVAVGAEVLHQIERSRRPQYVFVPGVVASSLVGDLDRVMTVEKAVVAQWARCPGCTTDAQARRFAYAVARKRSRFAFPEDFAKLARPLQGRLQEKHDRQSEEGAALRALREIRVRAAPSWDADEVEIAFWFIRDPDDTDFNGQNWATLLQRWLAMVPAADRFRQVEGVVTTLDDLTARDYVESDALDLDYLSSREVDG